MERLSSCYFCGTAVDAPLEEYPVVPPSLAPETEATITLCPTCRRKLGTVLGRVLDATGAADVEPLADAAGTADSEEPMDAVDDDDTPVDAADTADAPDEVDAASGDADPAVTGSEYNRVLRLLRNREFPVDRREFETIVMEAYELSPSDVEGIVEEAIRRGHLAEEGDRLVRPDGD